MDQFKPLIRLFFMLLAVMSLLVLATSLSNLTFRAGRTLTLPGGEQSSPPESSEVSFRSLNPEILERIVGGLLLWVLFPLSLVYFLVSPEVRKSVIQRALVMSLSAYAVYLVLQRMGPLVEELMARFGSESSPETSGNEALEMILPSSSSPFLTWAGNLLFVLLLFGISWFIFRNIFRNTQPKQHIRRTAQEGIHKLQKGRNVENTIYWCYREMLRLLDDSRPGDQQEKMTTRDLENELVRLGFPGSHVRALTRLFEKVRYGRMPFSTEEESTALSALQALTSEGRRI